MHALIQTYSKFDPLPGIYYLHGKELRDLESTDQSPYSKILTIIFFGAQHVSRGFRAQKKIETPTQEAEYVTL